jgi:hypothetical protein
MMHVQDATKYFTIMTTDNLVIKNILFNYNIS